MRVIVTGSAGFIGFHVAQSLLDRGDEVIGIDNLNDYYDVNLKKARDDLLSTHKNFSSHRINISDQSAVSTIFNSQKPDRVIHLAAQAGVRYSLENPHAYIEANLQGFMNILEGCRLNDVQHLVYASSSSVYGGNQNMPFSEHDNVDHPLSLYAATKKSNELMAHTYSHLYNLPTTGLRFFTVYGPWGRPDMALFLFTKEMLRGKKIQIYNNGNMVRDFTYIDDIVKGVVRILDKTATHNQNFNPYKPDPATSSAPYRIFNVGNGAPVPLLEYINALEIALGVTAKKDYLPMQPGDVPATAANTDDLEDWVAFRPSTSVVTGVQKFVDWYLCYYGRHG